MQPLLHKYHGYHSIFHTNPCNFPCIPFISDGTVLPLNSIDLIIIHYGNTYTSDKVKTCIKCLCFGSCCNIAWHILIYCKHCMPALITALLCWPRVSLIAVLDVVAPLFPVCQSDVTRACQASTVNKALTVTSRTALVWPGAVCLSRAGIRT